MKLSKDLLIPLIISSVSLVFSILILPLISLHLFHSPRISELGILEAWNIWDSPHYLDIATNWYVPSGEDANWIAFLPLFPMLVALIHKISFLGILYSGFFVSAAASIISSVIFYKLLRFDETKKTSTISLLMLFIFPTAFFLFIPYSESVFLLLLLLTFFYLRKGQFLTGSFFAMLSTATKIAGLALIPVIFAELILHHNLQSGKPIKFFKTFLVLNLPIIGFLFYLSINYLTFGDIFYFQKVQSENWKNGFSPLIPAFKQAVVFTTDREFEAAIYLGYSQIAALFLTLITVVYSFFKLRKSYFIFSLAFF